MSTKTPHPDRAVLEKIGDDALLAEGISDSCVKQWKYRGVPWSGRAKVARLAKARRIRLPPRFEEHRPPAMGA